MADLLKIALLAVVQGVTEFLPISSSGHLVILQRLLDFNHGVLQVNIVLHFGTLLAIIVYYRRDLLALCRPDQRQLLGYLVLGTLPLVIPGLVIKELVEVYYEQLWFTACGLLLTALLLLTVHRRTGDATLSSRRTAVLIGLTQCLAIWPGISRSGATIAVATRLGVGARSAAQFSFLLAVPAIIGAELVSLWQTPAAPATLPLPSLAVGFTISAVTGYLSLTLLLNILRRGSLACFGYYCALAALLVLILEMTTEL